MRTAEQGPHKPHGPICENTTPHTTPASRKGSPGHQSAHCSHNQHTRAQHCRPTNRPAIIGHKVHSIPDSQPVKHPGYPSGRNPCRDPLPTQGPPTAASSHTSTVSISGPQPRRPWPHPTTNPGNSHPNPHPTGTSGERRSPPAQAVQQEYDPGQPIDQQHCPRLLPPRVNNYPAQQPGFLPNPLAWKEANANRSPGRSRGFETPAEPHTRATLSLHLNRADGPGIPVPPRPRKQIARHNG